MKKTFHLIAAAACLWLVLLCPAGGSNGGGAAAAAQDFRTIADGVEHASLVRQIKSSDGNPEKAVVNLLRLDLTRVRLDVIHARDSAIGLEKTSSMASRYGAIAAINAGFFRIDRSIFEGDETGILQIDRILLSENINNRIAFGIVNDRDKTKVGFGHLKTEISISTGGGGGGRKLVPLSGINRERGKNEIILFTPHFNRTTLTNSDGAEFAVNTSARDSRLGNVVEVFENKGGAVIPASGFVISASGGGGGGRQNELSYLFKTPMKIVRWNVKISCPESEDQVFFSKAEDIIGGMPQLVRNGKIEITWQQEKAGKAFVEARHPRTAIAKLKDGKFLMATVDGRNEESGGINLYDLAALLSEMGAVDALNLDGGGSTTMFLDGKVINKPSDKEGERRVGSAIVVSLRK